MCCDDGRARQRQAALVAARRPYMRSRGSRNTNVRGDRPSSALSRTARIACTTRARRSHSKARRQGARAAATCPRRSRCACRGHRLILRRGEDVRPGPG